MPPVSRRSSRLFQAYPQNLITNHRPSSSSSQRTPPHPARSMTSLSQYRDDHPRYFGRAPSPLLYSAQCHQGTYDEFDDELNYPVDSIEYSQDSNSCLAPHYRSSPRPRSAGAIPSSMRQTPSPLRWAMQDLMDSLDIMSPQLPGIPSPRHSPYDPNILRQDDPLQEFCNYPANAWESPECFQSESNRGHNHDEMMAPYIYPADVPHPPLLDDVEKMQSKLDRFQKSQYSHQRERNDYDSRYSAERPYSQLSNRSDLRPRSSYSVDKSLATPPSSQPPIPPPHIHKHHGAESTTSCSTKNSIFSSSASDYSTAASFASTRSAGSAGSFARKKLRQLQKQEPTEQQTALGVLPKSNYNASALKHRKSYGSSLKKTIGKLLNASPAKPAPGTVTDHGDKIIEWQNVRRDVNRANTPSIQERTEYRERLEMLEGIQIIRPLELLEQIIEGDESVNGSPILPDEAFDISSMIQALELILIITEINFSLIDRATRLINHIPPQYFSSPSSFAKAVICRPYASEIQRLRAIFVFLSEKFTWEPLPPTERFELDRNSVSLYRLFEAKRGTSEEIAWCFWEMCQGCNIHGEVISGHLKCKASLKAFR